MSLSNRGSQRARLVAPGGPMYSFFQGISNEWRPDLRDGVVQLDVSENDLMRPELVQIHQDLTVGNIHKWPSLSGSMLPSCSSALLSVLALLLNQYFKPCKLLELDHLVGGAGCTLLLEQVVRVITDPGDVVLVPVPFWSMFSTVIVKADVTVYPLSVSGEKLDQFIPAEAAVSELESLLEWSGTTELAWSNQVQKLVQEGKRPRALLLTNPHNPLGRCCPREYLCSVADFCEKHDLFLISDEVFALSAHHPATSKFNSILSLDTKSETICNPGRFIVLWSVSKDFGVSQARVAVAAIPSNAALKDALMSFSMSFRISSFADSFFTAFLTATSPDEQQIQAGSFVSPPSYLLGGILRGFMTENGLRLHSAKKRLQDWCTQHGVVWLEADAGHFLMLYFGGFIKGMLPVNTPEIDASTLERKLSSHLLKHRVALRPGLTDYCPRPGWFRVTFSRNDEYMAEAFRRLDEALNTDKDGLIASLIQG